MSRRAPRLRRGEFKVSRSRVWLITAVGYALLGVALASTDLSRTTTALILCASLLCSLPALIALDLRFTVVR